MRLLSKSKIINKVAQHKNNANVLAKHNNNTNEAAKEENDIK